MLLVGQELGQGERARHGATVRAGLSGGRGDPQFGYSPVVSDGRRLYVAGYYTFYGLEDIPAK
jgi:hypothetical protein